MEKGPRSLPAGGPGPFGRVWGDAGDRGEVLSIK